ncbi:hypothetical protein [Alicyclobacillus mali (ex Roth et al. 2021)]|uniref:hypothetical protein n=1 Tax=Alicyclobacillus mali (ex Roth et al. 2021) TaxID=1123961 RepID=UPI0023F0B052|nr:hypothetical protein [Alicyclobacillus mali (ex Roth et al. 2021)]
MAPVFVLLAPIVGALCSNLVPGTAVPLGFWRGLVVQCALIAAPLAATWWGPVRWRNLLFHRAGARASLGLGIAYSAVYLLLLFAAERAGLHVSHFDLARRTLGLPVVLALYVPLWGFLEALWMAYVYAYLDLHEVVAQRMGRRAILDCEQLLTQEDWRCWMTRTDDDLIFGSDTVNVVPNPFELTRIWPP